MPDKPHQTTRKALAAKLGIDPKTLDTWRKQGAPVNDPAKLEVWLEERGKKKVEKGAVLDEKRQLEVARLKEQVARLRFDRETDEGKHVPVSSVALWLRQTREKEKTALLALPAQLAAPFGAIAPEIEAHATKAINEALERLAAEFQPTKP